MSKYFDGYASFDYKEMSKEKLITELKEKVRYIGELKRNNNEEIAKVQSAKDKTIAVLETKLAEKDEEINVYKKYIKVEDQDKISFAVKQLRQIKKLCEEKFDWWENSEWEGNIYDKSDVSNAYFDIEANIDELIEQLTHQHEDKGE